MFGAKTYLRRLSSASSILPSKSSSPCALMYWICCSVSFPTFDHSRSGMIYRLYMESKRISVIFPGFTSLNCPVSFLRITSKPKGIHSGRMLTRNGLGSRPLPLVAFLCNLAKPDPGCLMSGLRVIPNFIISTLLSKGFIKLHQCSVYECWWCAGSADAMWLLEHHT